MTSRTMRAIALPAGGIRPQEHRLTAAIQPGWTAFRSMLAQAAARRRVARSIAHLDDRLLADAGLRQEQRGLEDRLIRSFAAASAIWGGANVRGS